MEMRKEWQRDVRARDKAIARLQKERRDLRQQLRECQSKETQSWNLVKDVLAVKPSKPIEFQEEVDHHNEIDRHLHREGHD